MVSTQEQRAFWNSRADEWKNHADLGPNREKTILLIRQLIKFVINPVPNDSRVLNLGAGANTSNYFAKLVSNEQLYALDISDRMLAFNPSANKIQAAVPALPIANAAFEYCTSFFLMRYLRDENQAKLLIEIFCTLKNGGKFLVVDVQQNSYFQQQSQFKASSSAQNLLWRGLAKYGTAEQILGPGRSGLISSLPRDFHFELLYGLKTNSNKMLINTWQVEPQIRVCF